MDIIFGVYYLAAILVFLTISSRFFDDIDLLRQRWRSENTESVAELYASLN